ncbi:MAG: glycosyltransferase [Anaerolineae bacterium]|uniref:glycosyltransferase n=1 Tax=Promineifilum sp. TaxID=2664178 RepID=UPI001D6F7982|nr:glycosyltransferase [Anaerolineales bacterium]MCO5180031.1 glycosyltransferase [Promineifilum sp.]MCW5845780.1 glycosyltransferase [Anaerolineae bacterium]
MSRFSPDNPLRVCYFGTYRASYTRNQIILKGLQAQPDVTVTVCHATLWQGIEDRVAQASGGWRRPAFWRRVAEAYRQLIRRHRAAPDYDVMLIGYPGQFDAFLGRRLAHARGRPVALDILMSLHLVAEERGLIAAHPTTGRLIFRLEQSGLRRPDLLIAENPEYGQYIAAKYDLPAEQFRFVPHGADETVFHPRPVQPPLDHFRVTYHGGYLPSHGMDAILGAAALLRDDENVRFHFYGSGPEKERIVRLADEWALPNVTFHGFVSQDELLDSLAQAHVCLGVFGTTRQAQFTIQNKVWEGLAMGRAVVSGDSPTIRAALADRQEVYLIERDDPAALAAALRALRDDPAWRERMAAAGHTRYLAGNSIAAVGRQMKEALLMLVEDF